VDIGPIEAGNAVEREHYGRAGKDLHNAPSMNIQRLKEKRL
jgi:hypothetical protein